MTRSLTLTERQHEELRGMLFPGDGLEAAAILICRYTGPKRERLIVADILNVPDGACATRKRDFMSWPGSSIEEAIDKAEQHADAIVLTHSHPGGGLKFSRVDDASDLDGRAVEVEDVRSFRSAIRRRHEGRRRVRDVVEVGRAAERNP